MPKADQIRVLRVLEYTGPRDAVERTLAINQVKGTQLFGRVTIREALLGDFAELVKEPSDAPL
jgi:hypothetical protein